MAKQVLTLNDFSGGLNTVKDPRDIKNNELVTAQNIMVDEQGAVRTVGGMVAHTELALPVQAATLVGGYGLAMLESDYETEPVSYTAISNITFNSSGFLEGRTAISAFADAGGDPNKVTVTTSAAHGYSENESVNINNTTNYNGNYTITNVASTTYRIEHSFDGNDGTGRSNIRFGVKFPAGTEIKISGTSDNNGFYTVKYTTDVFMYLNVDAGIGALTGETVTSATILSLPKEDVLIILSDADNNNVDSYSKSQDVWTSSQMDIDASGGNQLNSGKIVYYSIDGAIRATDAEFANGSKVSWFGQIKRTHFGGTTAEDNYFDFFEKDNKLSAPTVGAIHLSNYPTANSGFNITVTHTPNTTSIWESAEYQVAFSFIYDGNQESLLYIPPSNGHTFTPDAGDSVTVVVRAQTDSDGYNPRISGGRVYAKVNDSDEEWFVLCDIDMRRGARATLSGEYTAWASVSGTTTSTGAIESIAPSVDTYAKLNGYSHSVQSNALGNDGEQWKWGLVANSRAFVFNVKRYDVSVDENIVYSDRMYFSEAGKFDTFPTSNYIDIVRGDSESYVAAHEYADRILAFKENSVQIVNISAGEPGDWFLESSEKYMGIIGPACSVKTQYGIAWVNDSGCFLYNGSEVKNLIDNKIDDDEWSDFIGNNVGIHYSSIGYERHKKQLIVMKDCTGTASSSGDAYLYDFKTGSWVKLLDAFSDSVVHSNFIHDWNGDLVVGYEDSSNVKFKKWDSDDTTSKSNVIFTTKDIDFGNPSLLKKIYAAYITYKLGANTQANPLEYSVDGKVDFTDITTGNGTATVGGSVSDTLPLASSWDVVKFTPASPISCQSLQLKFNLPSAGTFNINDVSIEYRQLRKRVN